MNALRKLEHQGQSIWLDYIRRSLITSGELKRLITEDGLSGVTSNPTIFEKAIAGSTDYDAMLKTLLDEEPHMDVRLLYERLAIEDIQMAADALQPVYNESHGADGLVSLEVSPKLAHDTKATIAEARRLWTEVNRPNLMIKVPATPEGIPAIESLIAAGINVNVTLMFSLDQYEAVAQAYLNGLKRNAHPEKVSSVASFFVSRVDTYVDRQLEIRDVGARHAVPLQGKIAIANAKCVYQRFRELFAGEFAPLKAKGARVQRVLWASTSTKNPAYRDVLYVEELIGPDTINTLPPATLAAFRDHGRVRGNTLLEGLEQAKAQLQELAKLGVNLKAITEALLAEGVETFAKSFDQLLNALEEKRHVILGAEVDRQRLALGVYRDRVKTQLVAWQSAGFARRLWAKDFTLWADRPDEISNRLGWLHLPEAMLDQVADFEGFAKEIRSEGIEHLVLLGMGGSSLAPQVFQRTFGNARSYPKLLLLDSTHPEAVRGLERSLDIEKAFFLVSSKSGTTLETLSLFRYFWAKTGQDGKRFAAITDPHTPLEQLANERRFRRVFRATPDVGGRYSALTAFGLVPAALIGLDIHRLLDQAWRMAEASAFCVPESENPGLNLGATLGELALAGRDKVTFFASSTLRAFPIWLEQLIAESTGKGGRGIVPVADEPLGSPEVYGSDRVFVHFQQSGEEGEGEALRAALEQAGHPVIRIRLQEKIDLAQEIFRWETAIAAAGAVLGIHPFNQPDVELAKELARKAMAGGTSGKGDAATVSAAQKEALAQAASGWLKQIRPGDYIAIQAYLAPAPEAEKSLAEIRVALRDRFKLATSFGYGPRFLHSTGQLHKGGPNTVLALQLIDEPTEDLAVPETDFSFGRLIQAQALGDYQALVQRDRRVLRVNLGADLSKGLKALQEAFRA